MLVAANKIDALDDPSRLERLRAHAQGLGLEVHAVSAASGEGLPALMEAVWRQVARSPVPSSADA
jgi:GTP-binding protein